MKDIGSIVAWLDDGALNAPGPRPFMEELCGRLTGSGIPLERAAIFVTMLHPDIAGLSSVWHRGQPVELGETPCDFLRTEAFVTHPIVGVPGTGASLRRRLDDNVVPEFPFLGKL